MLTEEKKAVGSKSVIDAILKVVWSLAKDSDTLMDCAGKGNQLCEEVMLLVVAEIARSFGDDFGPTPGYNPAEYQLFKEAIFRAFDERWDTDFECPGCCMIPPSPRPSPVYYDVLWSCRKNQARRMAALTVLTALELYREREKNSPRSGTANA